MSRENSDIENSDNPRAKKETFAARMRKKLTRTKLPEDITEYNRFIAEYMSCASNGEIETMEDLNSGLPEIFDKLPTFNSSTPLHMAMLYLEEPELSSTIKFLLEKYPDADLAKDKKGNLPIHVAVLRGNYPALEAISTAMKEKGRNLALFNGNNYSPLHIAAQKNNLEALEYLVETTETPFDCKKKSRTTSNLLAIEVAAVNNSTDTLEYLIKKHSEAELSKPKSEFDLKKAIKFACKKGNIEALSALLEAGGDIQHAYSMTKLPSVVSEYKKAVKAAFQDAISFIEKGDHEMLGRQLNSLDDYIKKAVVNMHDQQHPKKHLLNAAYLKETDNGPRLFKLLIDHGANPDIGRDYNISMKKSKVRPRSTRGSKGVKETRTMHQQYKQRFTRFLQRVEEAREEDRQSATEPQQDEITTSPPRQPSLTPLKGGGSSKVAPLPDIGKSHVEQNTR